MIWEVFAEGPLRTYMYVLQFSKTFEHIQFCRTVSYSPTTLLIPEYLFRQFDCLKMHTVIVRLWEIPLLCKTDFGEYTLALILKLVCK